MSKAEKGDPWFKFFPGDWRGDEKLRVCSLAARGLWIECLALMHKAEPYGHLLVAGTAPTIQELGKLVGASTGETTRMLDELKLRGVCSMTDGGVVFSRRMVRDKVRRLKASADGKRGGNPSLIVTDKQTLKGQVNGMHKLAQTQDRVPEARIQIDQQVKEQPAGADAPPVHQFFHRWAERFEEKAGQRPEFDRGKDAKTAKDLIDRHGIEEVLANVDEMFQSRDSWIRQSGYTVGAFKACFNKLTLARQAAPRNGFTAGESWRDLCVARGHHPMCQSPTKCELLHVQQAGAA